MVIEKRHQNIVTAAYLPPGRGGQKMKRIESERIPRRLLRLLAGLLFVVGGAVGNGFVSSWQPGSPLALAAFWLLYLVFVGALLFWAFLVGGVYLLLAWPRCDRCAGLGHPLSRTAVERQEQLYTWACRSGHVFHTGNRLQVLPHTRELHSVARGED